MPASPGHHDWKSVAFNDICHDTVERMLVPGGWIYRNTIVGDDGNDLALALVFVPRPPEESL